MVTPYEYAVFSEHAYRSSGSTPALPTDWEIFLDSTGNKGGYYYLR